MHFVCIKRSFLVCFVQIIIIITIFYYFFTDSVITHELIWGKNSLKETA